MGTARPKSEPWPAWSKASGSRLIGVEPKKRATRPLVDIGRRAELDDPPVHHDGDALGHRHGFDLVVRHVEEGHAEAPVQRRQLRAHLDAQLGIEVGERLVHQEHQGIAHHRPPEGDPLPLSARELARTPLRQAVDLQQRGDPPDVRVDGRAHRTHAGQQAPEIGEALQEAEPRHDQRHGDVLGHAHVGVERVVLEDHGDPALAGAQAIDAASSDRHPAAGLALQARDEAKNGGFPATRGPDERRKHAGANGQVDAVDRRRVAVSFGHTSEFERRPCHRSAIPVKTSDDVIVEKFFILMTVI
jgi:hypothetical protein